MISFLIKVTISNDPACAKMSTMEREMDVFSDLSRLRSEAEERRSALEEMREELGARRVAVAQNLNEAQDRHDKAKVTNFHCIHGFTTTRHICWTEGFGKYLVFESCEDNAA